MIYLNHIPSPINGRWIMTCPKIQYCLIGLLYVPNWQFKINTRIEYTYASTSGIKEYMLGFLSKLLLSESNIYPVFIKGQITNNTQCPLCIFLNILVQMMI